ncbi:restriction endonuclease fold toxin-2 domain-containing protein [Planctomycetes bacterium Pan216]|uniref:restriction endonuclease fold toxin-2 domain-containing protein n=1 Tax=Kolteria novifilia TaxID=2527975 RepID=UPI0011A86D5F
MVVAPYRVREGPGAITEPYRTYASPYIERGVTYTTYCRVVGSGPSTITPRVLAESHYFVPRLQGYLNDRVDTIRFGVSLVPFGAAAIAFEEEGITSVEGWISVGADVAGSLTFGASKALVRLSRLRAISARMRAAGRSEKAIESVLKGEHLVPAAGLGRALHALKTAGSSNILNLVFSSNIALKQVQITGLALHGTELVFVGKQFADDIAEGDRQSAIVNSGQLIFRIVAGAGLLRHAASANPDVAKAGQRVANEAKELTRDLIRDEAGSVPNPKGRRGRGNKKVEAKGKASTGNVGRTWTQQKYDEWYEGLETRDAMGQKQPVSRAYQIRKAGPKERLVRGGGTKVWVDGLDGTTIIEAKHVNKPKISPYIPYSEAFEMVRGKVLGGTESELVRMKAAILDESTPLVRVVLKTNINEAKPVFDRLFSELAIPGEVVVEP